MGVVILMSWCWYGCCGVDVLVWVLVWVLWCGCCGVDVLVSVWVSLFIALQDQLRNDYTSHDANVFVSVYQQPCVCECVPSAVCLWVCRAGSTSTTAT